MKRRKGVPRAARGLSRGTGGFRLDSHDQVYHRAARLVKPRPRGQGVLDL